VVHGRQHPADAIRGILAEGFGSFTDGPDVSQFRR